MSRYLGALIFALFAAHASASITDSCIKKLAQENRFHVKLPEKAVLILAKAIDHGVSSNSEALLIDYSQNSRSRRAFLVNFSTCDITTREHVIHGGTIYHPSVQNFGELHHDGMLNRCLRPDGTRKNMTRPGLFITAGCHVTREQNWTSITNSCQGANLESRNSKIPTSAIAGVVLHEHIAIHDDGSILPAGQGCPAFPPGRLKALVPHGVMRGMLVYVNAPQCD